MIKTERGNNAFDKNGILYCDDHGEDDSDDACTSH